MGWRRFHRGPLPGPVRLAVPGVGLAGVHRHRRRPRRRPGLRPGGQVRQRLPRPAERGRRADLHDLRDVRAADHAQPVDGHDVPGDRHGGALRRGARRPQLGELARPAARRPDLVCTQATRSSSTSERSTCSETRGPRGQGHRAVVLRPDGAPADRWPAGDTTACPVLVFPTAGGDAEEIERHQLLGHLGRPHRRRGGSRSTPSTASPGRAMATDEGSVEYRCWLFNQFQQAIAPRWCPPSTRTRRAARGHRRRGVDRGVQLAGADLPLAAAVPGGHLHERHLRTSRSSSAASPTTSTSPRRCTSCPGSTGRSSTACASGSSTSPRDRGAGRTSASPGGRPRSSARRACPTGSTTGARIRSRLADVVGDAADLRRAGTVTRR